MVLFACRPPRSPPKEDPRRPLGGEGLRFTLRADKFPWGGSSFPAAQTPRRKTLGGFTLGFFLGEFGYFDGQRALDFEQPAFLLDGCIKFPSLI